MSRISNDDKLPNPLRGIPYKVTRAILDDNQAPQCDLSDAHYTELNTYFALAFKEIDDEINKNGYKGDPEHKIRYIEYCLNDSPYLQLFLKELFTPSEITTKDQIEDLENEIKSKGLVRTLLKRTNDYKWKPDTEEKSARKVYLSFFRLLGKLIKRIEAIEIEAKSKKKVNKREVIFKFSKEMVDDLNKLLNNNMLHSFKKYPDFKKKLYPVLLFDLWDYKYQIDDYSSRKDVIISTNVLVNGETCIPNDFTVLRYRSGFNKRIITDILPHLKL